MRTSIPFCVLDRPFVVWSDDVDHDRRTFLDRVDAEFYMRAAHWLVAALDQKSLGAEDARSGKTTEADESRKDISSLSRLLWYHGVETLVMMLGAYIQVPSAVHAYFIKCRTEDILKIAQSLLKGRRLLPNRINDAQFSVVNLLRGIHLRAGWTDRDDTVQRFGEALNGMLATFVRDEHRFEYNSIKHGLRASHGSFALTVGIEERPGVEAAPDAMQLVGYSRDASFFDVPRPLRNANKEASRINFILEKVSVTWSLERVLCDLQILSVLIGNTISALQIAAGAAPGTVRFRRPENFAEWWQHYQEYYAGAVPTSSFCIDIDAAGMELPTSDDVLASYRDGAWKW